jgi:hypothetical protein
LTALTGLAPISAGGPEGQPVNHDGAIFATAYPTMKLHRLRCLLVLIGITATFSARATTLEVGTVSDSDNGLIIIDLFRGYYQDDFGNYDGAVSFNLINQTVNHGYASVLNGASDWYMLYHNVYIEPTYNYEGTIRMYIIAPPGHYVLDMQSTSSHSGDPYVSASVVTVGAANSDWENYHPGETPPYATY